MNASSHTLEETAVNALDLPLPEPFKAVFTTRHGGMSKGNYESLNLALHVGDDPRRVRDNRRLAFTAHKLDSSRLIVAQQIHGAEAAIVSASDAGRGSFSHADAIEGCDAIVTRAANLPLMNLSADCLLLALGDPQAKVLAVLHGGWRGIAAGIIQNTITLMRSAGAKPERIHVAGTPAIGRCCFEVGSDVVQTLGPDCVVRTENEKSFIDLNRAALKRLTSAGVPEQQIQLSSDCTCCREDLFFSHRRCSKAGEKHTGRMALIAWM
ncbi:MAG TPA: polyphenol oxidase family protein [Planctomycetota bacterium]|nr:polyphenol oxidase family protein [Planctomycetota bacterium]